MNIFVFGTRGFPNIQGGVEKHCESLYPFISKKFRVTVFRRKSYVTKPDFICDSNLKFIDLPSTRIKGFEAFFHSFLCTLYCIVKRPDIVHVHNIGPGLFIPLLKIFRLKTILTYHSANYEHAKWGFGAKQLLRLGELVSLKFSDYTIFVNKLQHEKFATNLSGHSIFLPNGITIKEKLQEHTILGKYGISPYRYILSVGRITQEKGFDYLIDSFNSLELENFHLVLVGGMDHDHSYFDTLKRKCGNVVFTGYLDGIDLQELYSFAKLFVLPSYNEGYPLVLLEAASYKLPILASNIPSNLQLGFPDANYFMVGSISDLKQKITDELALLGDGRTSKDYNIKLYSWFQIADTVIEIYNKILKK